MKLRASRRCAASATLLAFLSFAAACGTNDAIDVDDAETADASKVTFADLKQDLESNVAERVAELERKIGELRSDADETNENFNSELVHLNDLIADLQALVNDARVEDSQDLASLRTEVARRVEDIEQAYADVELRVKDASSSTDF